MDILKTGNILVPHDFSEVADNALDFASKFAKIFNKKISLLHVVEKQGVFGSKSSSESINKKAEGKLKTLADNNTANCGIETDVIIKSGNIFDQIGETATENNCTLIVMGTHGIKGMQALTGSKAMKVITNSSTPFVVVQKKPWNPAGIKEIVVPINEDPETKQKLKWSQFFAKIFNSKLHILSQERNDEFINNKINNNVAWTKNTLKHEGIPSELIQIDAKSDYYKSTLGECVSIGADLIIVNTDPDTNIANYVMGLFEQKIIANEAQIPVMCINTKEVYSIIGNVFSYTS